MEEVVSSEEALAQKHKQEKRDLQATIQGLKKTATKGDKKKKKEVQEQITKLEATLIEKHKAELSSLKEIVPCDSTDELNIEEINLNDNKSADKPTKAQKRRNKKDVEIREREKRINEQEIENESGLRNVETNNIKKILKQKNLMIYDIPSDGDCLYKAVDHNLLEIGIVAGIVSLRNKVSQYMLSHPDQYKPFLTDPKSEEPFTNEQLQEYCEKVRSTKQWGSHVELDALSNILQKALVIVQGDGPELVIGEQYLKEGVITLCYHRHMYSLGEHYNSVQKYQEEEEL